MNRACNSSGAQEADEKDGPGYAVMVPAQVQQWFRGSQKCSCYLVGDSLAWSEGTILSNYVKWMGGVKRQESYGKLRQSVTGTQYYRACMVGVGLRLWASLAVPYT